MPHLDDVSGPYWTGGAAAELRIAQCVSCRRYTHPPQSACPECGGAMEFVAVSGHGVLFTYTVSYQQFHPDVPTPFAIGLVELDEQPGLRVAANIVDCGIEALTCGMPVRVKFEQHGSAFVPVFAPTRSEAAHRID
ncbi:DNA-binding protein [Mycolicibacter terrae]|nr:DNA-binding protein [Mycolicibacter terrae]